MSSDSEVRACVTMCTCDRPRPLWVNLTLSRYACCHAMATIGVRRSAGLADRGHVEALDPHRRHRGAVEVVAPFTRQGGHGGADLRKPPEHAHRRLVEPEVVHRADHL